jgi:hypothetical protein
MSNRGAGSLKNGRVSVENTLILERLLSASHSLLNSGLFQDEINQGLLSRRIDAKRRRGEARA